MTYFRDPKGGNGPEILLRHATWSRATTAASLLDLKPKVVLSFSAVLCQVSLGLARLVNPQGPFKLDIRARFSGTGNSLNIAFHLCPSTSKGRSTRAPFLGTGPDVDRIL